MFNYIFHLLKCFWIKIVWLKSFEWSHRSPYSPPPPFVSCTPFGSERFNSKIDNGNNKKRGDLVTVFIYLWFINVLEEYSGFCLYLETFDINKAIASIKDAVKKGVKFTPTDLLFVYCVCMHVVILLLFLFFFECILLRAYISISLEHSMKIG